MSPRLARSSYFLAVLNEPAFVHTERVQANGVIAAEMYQLLLMLAERVREKTVCTPEEIRRINDVFQQYSAIRLRVVPQEGAPDVLWSEAQRGPLARAAVHALIESQESDRGRRVYFEALVSLLEALEDGPLELGTCRECGSWFIPYNRAPVTKFCSSRCRNRYNYKIRRGEAL